MSAVVLTAVVLTAGISFVAALLMTRFSAVLGFTDLPNERSLHTRVTPRAGGVGFALVVPSATAATLAVSPGGLTAPIATLLVASVTIALVGLADDRWNLPITLRLLAQLVAATIVVQVSGLSFAHEIGAAVATIAIVGVTNIYNFMDGIDGLAGSQALIASSCLAVLGFLQGRPQIEIAMLLLAAGVAGFLALNWPPARIFMGDVGSTFLGFSFSAWAVIGVGEGSPGSDVWEWAAVLSPFLFDGIYTLVKRIFRGESVYRAHRDHLYQQLVRGGWSHRRTTGLYALVAIWAGVWVVISGVRSVNAVADLVVAMAPLCALPLIVRGASVSRSNEPES